MNIRDCPTLHLDTN